MYIYFALAIGSDAIKIGKSEAPRKRVNELQVGNHCRIVLFATIKVPGRFINRDWEGMCHKRFEKDRIRGEWFALSDEIIDFMDVIKGNNVRKFMDFMDIKMPDEWLDVADHYLP